MGEDSLRQQRKVGGMNRLHAFMPFLFLTLTAVQAQTPQSHGKPTEQVIIQYEKLVAKGAFLRPDDWKAACKLYDQSREFSPRAEISLMSVGGSLGENWLKDNRAEVETKWTDYWGTIDAALRYRPPKRSPPFDVPVTMTTFVFQFVYTNKHREVGTKGETIREITGPWEWKIEQPRMARWATLRRAIEYVTQMRDKTDDPIAHQGRRESPALWLLFMGIDGQRRA
jgi:hypothetical protein